VLIPARPGHKYDPYVCTYGPYVRIVRPGFSLSGQFLNDFMALLNPHPLNW